jgi:DNA-binding NarL/FixJ family response regulator
MKSTKRVILADGSRLLRELLHHAIDKADRLQVVDEIPSSEGLFSAIQKFDPEWVIVSLPYSEYGQRWLRPCLTEYPSVRFVFLSPDQNHITMKWQMSYEEDYANLSLGEFIHILEKDLQPI